MHMLMQSVACAHSENADLFVVNDAEQAQHPCTAQKYAMHCSGLHTWTTHVDTTLTWWP
jgi:hypothetical protein